MNSYSSSKNLQFKISLEAQSLHALRRRDDGIALLTIPHIFQNRIYVQKFTHPMKELKNLAKRIVVSSRSSEKQL